MPLAVAVILGCLICYFVCGIPFGLVFARARGVDVRKVGSHNIGTTNVARSVGASAAVATLACDALKGAVCMLVTRLLVARLSLGGDIAATDPRTAVGWVSSLLFLACICGHVFSPYLGFHGGKGIAVGFGGALGLYWPVGLGLLAVFVAVAVPTRYVSAGSVAADLSVLLWGLVFRFTPLAFVPLVLIVAIVAWAHRENIGKLLRGEESKFAFHHEGGDATRGRS